MAKPNSNTTLIRRVLVSLLDPYPPPGHAWCVDCVMFEGRTLILHSDEVVSHLESHIDVIGPDGWVSIKGSKKVKSDT
jgi:hypothetical protein